MSKESLRNRVRAAFRSSDDKALNEAGFTYTSGALTKEGRKVVLDFIFDNDDALKSEMVKIAEALNEDACERAKKK